jgi:hypothetical protein
VFRCGFSVVSEADDRARYTEVARHLWATPCIGAKCALQKCCAIRVADGHERPKATCALSPVDCHHMKTRAISQRSSVAANHHHGKPRNNWIAITPHATPKIPTNKRLPCANAKPAPPPASRESPNSSPRSGSIRGAFISLASLAP